MVPPVKPVSAFEIATAEPVVALPPLTVLMHDCSTPESSVVFEVAKQKVGVVDAPFAVTDPLIVAVVAVTEEADEVVTEGAAEVIKLYTWP